MDSRMKKVSKMIYPIVDDVYMITKSKRDKNTNDIQNFDIYIADNYIGVINYHQYDLSNDKNHSSFIYEFLSVLSSSIELILYVLKNKDIYIPRFVYIIRTHNEQYYSFEYKSTNIFVKQIKHFDS